MSIMEEYRSKRLMKRIRLKELYKALGCTIGLISNWENSRGRMSKEKIRGYMDYVDSN
jgi:transcriptional regulator with XRE-family HTH domain